MTRASSCRYDVYGFVVPLGVSYSVLANGKVLRVVAPGMRARPLVTRPTEVLDNAVVDIRDPVHLFVDRPADIADPQLLRSGSEREPERVAQTSGDDPALVGVVTRTQRIAGHRCPGVRVESQYRAAQPGRITGSAQILRAERAALIGRVAARVSPLSVVDDLMVRAFARAEVQRAVRAEPQRAHRMARELLAPVVDQYVLGCRRVPGRGQA